MSRDSRAALAAAIETIETSYEFMLAYAAQGRDKEGGPGPSIRATLEKLAAALDGIGDDIAAGATGASPEIRQAFEAFAAVLRQDAGKAAAGIRLALSVPSIGSQLVDNLNASIHIRALLTDVFLIDETLKSLERSR